MSLFSKQLLTSQKAESDRFVRSVWYMVHPPPHGQPALAMVTRVYWFVPTWNLHLLSKDRILPCVPSSARHIDRGQKSLVNHLFYK
jgi:hypothetical protein